NQVFASALNQVKCAELYAEHQDLLNAGRYFARAGSAFATVNAFHESAKAYEKCGDMFAALKGEFFVEAAKHYKFAAMHYINPKEKEFVNYISMFEKTLKSYEEAKATGNINERSYILYITNLYSDVQETLNRNGYYKEEKELYVEKMDYIRKGYRLDKKNFGKYIGMSIWKYSCIYGESAVLWSFWIFMQLLFFSYLFRSFGLVVKEGMILSFGESMFFSIDIFATLGFGNYELVSGVARFVAAMDVISGYFMMAMLITIFTRKLTR
ncbi:MAG: hypothetical protein HQL28_05635, partial [Candidatus Omnitrophica bacterium]|nr:hypothetical protein [Candidatus Omnitrophota bacterium]